MDNYAGHANDDLIPGMTKNNVPLIHNNRSEILHGAKNVKLKQRMLKSGHAMSTARVSIV